MFGLGLGISNSAPNRGTAAPAGTTLTAGSGSGAVGYSSVLPIGSISGEPVLGQEMIELSQFDAGGGITGLRLAFTGDVHTLTATVTINGVLHTEADLDFVAKSDGTGGFTSWTWGPLVDLPFTDGVTVPIAATLE